MRYSEDIVEQVRTANDIVDVIGTHVKLTKKGSNYFGLCPFHGEKTPSFSVSPSKQIYYCFGCGAGGNVIGFLMNYENLSFLEALKILADRAGISLPEPEKGSDDSRLRDLKSSLYDINKTAALFYYRYLHTAEGGLGYDYFAGKRRLSEKTITHFGLGFSPKSRDGLYKYLKGKGYPDSLITEAGLCSLGEKGASDRFWNRVIFPIMDVGSRVIGFGGRVMGDALPKYINSAENVLFDKSSVLYGLNFAKKSREKYMLLCEGYMDVIALHQAGFTNAVASLGTAFNEKHARLLKRYTDTVILTQDSDTAGVNAKLRAYPILYSAGLNVRVLTMEGAKDPDEFISKNGTEAYEQCIKNARNGFLFTIDECRKKYDLSDPAGKTAFYDEVSDKLCMFEQPLERQNYTESVSREFMISYDELHTAVENRFLRNGTRASGMSPVYEEARPETTARKPDAAKSAGDSAIKYERLLASWLYERPELLKYVINELDLDDFRDAASKRIIEELSMNREIIAADFLSGFEADDESARQAAAIFAGAEGEGRLKNYSTYDIEKGLSEALRSLKLIRLDEKLKSTYNPAEYSRLQTERNALMKFRLKME